MNNIGIYVSDFFAFLAWVATIKGNSVTVKNHKIFGIVLNGILNAVKGGSSNDGSKPGSDSGSGSSSVSG